MGSGEPALPGRALLVDLDTVLVERLRAVCAEQSLEVEVAAPGAPAVTGGAAGRADPVVVVVGVPDEESARRVRDYRQRWPDALLLGVAGTPDPITWRLAQRSVDLVVNRGAAARLLRDRLATRGQGGPRRFPLCDAADAAGRLGLVTTVSDTPVGPVALFRVDGRLSVIADCCPHAGAELAHGDLDGAVLTCPRHGSQFHVGTGERLRGPADDPVGCWRVVEDSGQLWMLVAGNSEGG
ncbi:MAG: Rieske (2Fe-2S) protein [Mycobacteriales bacterium]